MYSNVKKNRTEENNVSPIASHSRCGYLTWTVLLGLINRHMILNKYDIYIYD